MLNKGVSSQCIYMYIKSITFNKKIKTLVITLTPTMMMMLIMTMAMMTTAMMMKWGLASQCFMMSWLEGRLTDIDIVSSLLLVLSRWWWWWSGWRWWWWGGGIATDDKTDGGLIIEWGPKPWFRRWSLVSRHNHKLISTCNAHVHDYDDWWSLVIITIVTIVIVTTNAMYWCRMGLENIISWLHNWFISVCISVMWYARSL